MKKILVITDMTFQGSGYFYISVPLFTKLSEMGYDVRILGFGYKREEHNYPFQILAVDDTRDVLFTVQNLVSMPDTNPDLIIIALDIPQQLQFRAQLAPHNKKVIAITPLENPTLHENPPITLSWTAPLMQTDFIFFISELGKKSALASGLSNVDHLQVGIDTHFWRVPTAEEKTGLRHGMGIEDDEFVVLTVAENQERKNLSAAMEIVSKVKKRGIKVRYVLVSRTETIYGWNLRDLAVSNGINSETILMNKGMPIENLWSLYAMSDCFLLTSKGEGLGMPVLEAMSCGVPVVATDTGAMKELLSDGRGLLVPSAFSFTDPWGNSRRDMIDTEIGAEKVESVYNESAGVDGIAYKARMYVESRIWDIPAQQLAAKIEELTHE